MSKEQEQKDRFRYTARDLFMRYGIRSISMDDLAQELGVSKKTIYMFYKDKDELVLDVVKDVLNDNIQKCDEYRAAASNAIEQEFLAMQGTTMLYSSMNPSLLHDLKKYHPEAYSFFTQYKREGLLKIIKESYKWGVEDGLFREDMNIDVLAVFRLESINILFDQEVHQLTNSNFSGINAEVFRFFLQGMATRKGREVIKRYIKKLNH